MEHRSIQANQGNYTENVKGDYVQNKVIPPGTQANTNTEKAPEAQANLTEQKGSYGIGIMTGGTIGSGAKVAAVINEVTTHQTGGADQMRSKISSRTTAVTGGTIHATGVNSFSQGDVEPGAVIANEISYSNATITQQTTNQSERLKVTDPTVKETAVGSSSDMMALFNKLEEIKDIVIAGIPKSPHPQDKSASLTLVTAAQSIFKILQTQTPELFSLYKVNSAAVNTYLKETCPKEMTVTIDFLTKLIQNPSPTKEEAIADTPPKIAEDDFWDN